MPSAVREPGWYPDRNDPGYNRYWNGRAWTARRSPVGATPPPLPGPEVAAPQVPRQEGATSQAPRGPAEHKQRIPVWMWVIGALFLVRSVFSLMAAFDHPAPGTTTAVPSHPAVVAPSPGTSH